MRLRYSEVTPRRVYHSRRRFFSTVVGGVTAATLRDGFASTRLSGVVKTSYDAGGERVTSPEIVTTYNNFYEFGTGKDEPAKRSGHFQTSPWMVRLEGEVIEPKTLDIDAIMRLAPLEERIYRHRCVEGWSIVVPWIGFSLSALLKQVQPTGKARYVAFESVYDKKQMISTFAAGIQFPYVEGLRLDEAMHPLALLGVGLYGETLPNQNGAPLRLVLPWKYGFKSIKSIVRIRFVEKEPRTTWNIAWPQAYGFYSNVNPKRDHPSHSQKWEYRLGESVLQQRRATLPFNGYEEVAGLYAGMDLRRYY
ncbi:MAG TPA: protein-methionine-sulfoxide reductase catalytic subunit MsrP [Bryobacteraceae bacterium]|nr:protein-methionine-sulfoxide reductase catalytic subunit MsrP [Bryobacteraceae bacterium]